MKKKFYTTAINGDIVIRDLEEENKLFNYDDYISGKFDSYNYQWYEIFNHYIYDDLGCDYERYGCYIKEGDVVLDIGANIGIFAHRAEIRGASKVICFEPLTPTYECLVKNKGEKTITYKNAVGGNINYLKFKLDSDFTNTGGGTHIDNIIGDQKIIYTENVFVININNIFESFNNKIDFVKIDIEGGEVDLLTSITDKNLKSIRCLSSEFHNTYNGFDEFQENFINRMNNLGFNYFVLYHGDGCLRTLNFWKK